MTPGKTIALIMQTSVGKVMSLLYKMMSSFGIAFLPRNKYLFISWLQLQSAVIWETKKKHLPLFPLFLHLFAMEWWDQMPWTLCFECCFKPAFSLSSFTFIKKLFIFSLLSAIRVVLSAYLGYWFFSQQSWFQKLVIFPAQHFHDVLCI